MDPRYPRTGFFNPPILSGFGDALACGEGFFQVCSMPRPGEPTTPDMCYCHPNPPPAQQVYNQAASLATFHWGLIAGIAIAGYLVFKVATR